MKRIKTSALLILSSILVVISFSACSDDLDLPTKEPQAPSNIYPLTDVHVMESGYVNIKQKQKFNSAKEASKFSASDVIFTPISEEEAKALTSKKSNTFKTGEAGADGSMLGVYKWVTLLYRCKTADGSEKDLSELIVWPYCSTPSQLVIGCHSTITSDAQRPTNFSNLPNLGEINMLALFTSILSQNALVIVPDYEGYGITANLPHPYCNRDLTAEQVVIGVKAGLSWFEDSEMKMADGWSGVSIGYSQGGAVSAGVLRYCQKNGDNSLRLKGAVCGDGPYDPLATLKRYIDMDHLYMPVAPAMLLKGAVDTDPDMMALQCKYEDFVTDKFSATGIFKMIEGKQSTTDDIQAVLLDYSKRHGDEGGFTMMAKCSEGFLPYTQNNLKDGSGKTRDFELENGKGYNYCTVDQCLKPGVIAYFRDGTVTGEVPVEKLKALENSLAKNALTADGFMPSQGFTFFHSTGDEVVPYCNLESVRNTWGAGSIKTVSLESFVQLHVATGTLFFTMKCGSLVDEILKGQWAPGEFIVGI